jgi:hypothetical protein
VTPGFGCRSQRHTCERSPRDSPLRISRLIVRCPMVDEAEVATFDGVAFSLRGDTCLVVYAVPARIARTRWLFDRVDEAVASLETFYALMLILPSADPPDAATRAENARRLRSLHGKLRGLVTVIIGDTFRVNVIRTVMRGMFVVQRQSEALSVARTLADGLRCVLQAPTKQTRSAAQLGTTIKQMCRALGHESDSL